ncbi:hypothetical protein Ptc2401_00838 [Prosthecochloris sp. CIB 2401]|nr:hypothetical protein Ptc2401_00838 [Prosthecochloris sp. CIB 2401]
MHGTEFVDDPLGLLAGIVQEPDIRRIGDVCRSTGGIDDEFALVGRAIVSVVVAIVLLFPVLRPLSLFSQVPLQELLLQRTEIGMLQPFPEMGQHRGIEGRSLLVRFKTDEELEIRVLLDLFDRLDIRKAEFLLDDQGPQRHADRECRSASFRQEVFGIHRLGDVPGNYVSEPHPPVFRIEFTAERQMEIFERELVKLRLVHESTVSR